MNMIEQIDAHADWMESEAVKADSKEECQAALIGAHWDECLRGRDIDAPIGGGFYGDLIEVLDDAQMNADQTINRAMMQALVHCAAKGQPEAVVALGKVKDFFITRTMEFHK